VKAIASNTVRLIAPSSINAMPDTSTPIVPSAVRRTRGESSGAIRGAIAASSTKLISTPFAARSCANSFAEIGIIPMSAIDPPVTVSSSGKSRIARASASRPPSTARRSRSASGTPAPAVPSPARTTPPLNTMLDASPNTPSRLK